MAETVTTPVKVALWCTPRSTSTVLTRCLSAIDGIEVCLELFSYAFSCRGIFFMSTGRELPPELEGNEAVYDEANAVWEKYMGHKLMHRRMSYQKVREDLENTTSRYVLIKEMAINVIDTKFLPSGFKHTFLIRDPSRVYASARKASAPKYAETGLITSEVDYDLIRDDPINSQPMGWFERQHTLWKYIKENVDPEPVVIDAFDLLSRPGPILKAYCDAVGFPYNADLLKWEATNKIPQNFVTANDNLISKMFQFYERAFNSTHFVPPQDAGPIPRNKLSDDVIRCVEYSMPYYREMFESRLQAL